jgi:hypothetical protein
MVYCGTSARGEVDRVVHWCAACGALGTAEPPLYLTFCWRRAQVPP